MYATTPNLWMSSKVNAPYWDPIRMQQNDVKLYQSWCSQYVRPTVTEKITITKTKMFSWVHFTTVVYKNRSTKTFWEMFRCASYAIVKPKPSMFFCWSAKARANPQNVWDSGFLLILSVVWFEMCILFSLAAFLEPSKVVNPPSTSGKNTVFLPENHHMKMLFLPMHAP